MNTTRLYQLVIAILLLVNATTIGFVWLNSGDMARRPGSARMFLAEELQMAGPQKASLEAIEVKHHQEKRALVAKSRALQENLFDLLQNPATDSSEVNAAAEAIVQNMRVMELMTYYHFKTVKDMCTPTQWLQLDQHIHRAMQQMGGGAPNGHRPPPPRR